MGCWRGAAGSALLVAVLLAAGCGRVAAAGDRTPVSPAAPAFASPSPSASSSGARPARHPAYLVTRITVTVNDAGERLAPPAAGARPRITAARALFLARHRWGDPHGAATTEVALASYTDLAQGTALSGGRVRPFVVDRLAWAVIDRDETCLPAGGPPGSPHLPSHHCVSASFVDAETGQDLGSFTSSRPGLG